MRIFPYESYISNFFAKNSYWCFTKYCQWEMIVCFWIMCNKANRNRFQLMEQIPPRGNILSKEYCGREISMNIF